VRKSLSIVVLAAASALLLTACAGGGDAKTKSTPKPTSSTAKTVSVDCSLKPGAVSDGVQISGAQGTTPTVKVTKGASAKSEQRTVVTKGSGDDVKAGTKVVIGFAAYDATSGATLQAPSGWGADRGQFALRLGASSQAPGFTRMFGCEPVGSRIVYAAKASTAFGSAKTVTSDFSDGSVKPGDTLVFVGDILEAKADKATGAPQPAKPGMPAVKDAADGTPKVSYDKSSTPPSTTQVAVLKKGTGAKVASGDLVSVQYQGTEWKSGKIFDQSWGTSHGCDFASVPSAFPTTGVVKGFAKALEGQTVGSQVEVVMTPADGYGSNPPSGQKTITKDSTLIFVVDILGVDMTAAQVQSSGAQGTTCD
jgi:peptidylprolyl isomerase